MSLQFSLDDVKLLTRAKTVAGSATIGVTPVLIMSLNTTRRIAIITNDSAADIYIGFNNSIAINRGIRINALGGSFMFGLFTDTPWCGEIWAVAAGAGNNLTFVEV